MTIPGMATVAVPTGFLAILILVSALNPLVINMFVPSMPGIMTSLGTDFSTVQFVLSYYLFATAIAQLVLGPLSDRFGRRPVLILSLAMLGVDYLITGLSPTITWLFVGRTLSGMAGAAYSTAKMMGVVAAQSYRKQYGLNATVIIPGNMYGEYDNFHPRDSHVVPAMIRRYYEARLNNAPFVEMWGTGAPERDFVYAGDVAKTIPFFIESFDESGPVNLSSGTRTPIKELATTIAKVAGYEGEIRWDASKPDGQMVKIFDTQKMAALGLTCSTPLLEGLKRTADWLAKNYAGRGDGLRL